MDECTFEVEKSAHMQTAMLGSKNNESETSELVNEKSDQKVHLKVNCIPQQKILCRFC